MVDYPSDWIENDINLIADLFDNQRIPIAKSQRKKGNIPYYGANGIQDYVSGFTHNGEFILLAEDGASDIENYPIKYVFGKIWVNNHAHVLAGKEKNVDTKFLAYLLSRVDFSQFLVGGTRAKLNAKALREIKVIYPKDIEEQKAIANVLSDFDEHIDNLTELIEKKKAIREGALEDLVSGRTRVDGFDGEWIKVTFDEVIIPKARIGWQGLKKEEYLTSGYSYLIGGVDFNDGTINLDEISYVTRERFEMDSNIQVESNNVLVTKDGTIGKVALVPVIDKPATLNSGVFVFKTKESLIPTFLYRVLLSSVFRKFIDTLSAGSTIKHLYQKDLKKFSFFMPKNLDEQKAISSILMDIDDEIKDLESEKEKMIQIREGAMNDLLTGRVRLKP